MYICTQMWSLVRKARPVTVYSEWRSLWIVCVTVAHSSTSVHFHHFPKHFSLICFFLSHSIAFTYWSIQSLIRNIDLATDPSRHPSATDRLLIHEKAGQIKQLGQTREMQTDSCHFTRTGHTPHPSTTHLLFKKRFSTFRKPMRVITKYYMSYKSAIYSHSFIKEQ